MYLDLDRAAVVGESEKSIPLMRAVVCIEVSRVVKVMFVSVVFYTGRFLGEFVSERVGFCFCLPRLLGCEPSLADMGCGKCMFCRRFLA